MSAEIMESQQALTKTGVTQTQRKTAYVMSVLFGVGFLCFVTVSQSQPEIYYAIGAMGCAFGLLVVMLASFIMSLKCLKGGFLKWMGPVALSGGFLLLTPAALWLGRSVGDWKFKGRLQDYAAVVADIRNGKISVPETFSEVQVKTSLQEVKQVKAMRKADGSVLVLFLTGTGFPLHHSGYLFDGCGTNAECIGQFNTLSNNFALRNVSEKWYHFSD